MKVTSRFNGCVSVKFILEQFKLAEFLDVVQEYIDQKKFPKAVSLLNDRNVWLRVRRESAHIPRFKSLCEDIFNQANPNSDCYEVSGTLATMFDSKRHPDQVYQPA